jgi:hypothetical protein
LRNEIGMSRDLDRGPFRPAQIPKSGVLDNPKIRSRLNNPSLITARTAPTGSPGMNGGKVVYVYDDGSACCLETNQSLITNTER